MGQGSVRTCRADSMPSGSAPASRYLLAQRGLLWAHAAGPEPCPHIVLMGLSLWTPGAAGRRPSPSVAAQLERSHSSLDIPKDRFTHIL